ncbi:NUMOD4 domain-containing protein [Paenibacillus algicola]|uniref:NUMOD4 domain-containing protein n=1 Tax=Paenibacillus algicola TaxID=2565926 RepID=UPI0010FE81F1|nr:3-ketosteroid-delta-1-dehydrogenase [Paenibacillus algicola]
MEEERRSIKGYEGIYDITRSGRIIIVKNNRVRHRSGNEYGYVNVHLRKNGERKLYKTFELWQKSFAEIDPSEYKGMQ